LRRFANWLFADSRNTDSPWRVILWWELRRIPFNIIIGIYGVLCFVIFLFSILTSGHLKPGEDAVEPMAIMAAPFGINFLYTLGWLVEVPARIFKPDLSPRFGPLLLKLGIGLGMLLITLPAACWGGYRLLQLAGVLS
jgi:hypothetical protein